MFDMKSFISEWTAFNNCSGVTEIDSMLTMLNTYQRASGDQPVKLSGRSDLQQYEAQKTVRKFGVFA